MKFEEVIFEDLFEEPLKNGLSKPKRVRGEGYPMVNMGEIFAFDRITDIPMDLVPMTDREKETAYIRKYDLLFARQSLTLAGAGKCSVFIGNSKETTYESHLIRVRLAQEKCNPLFYYYYFNSAIGKQNIGNIVEQVAAAGIRGSDLKKLRVPFPRLAVQNEIAYKMQLLDEKIENNQSIIGKLEKITELLFKRWFIDFEFPNEQGLPYGSSGGEMVDSELGKIPKEWKVGTAGDLFEFSPTVKLSKGTEAPFIEMKNLNNSAMIFDWIYRDFTGSGSKFRGGDTLLARITPCLENGKIGYVDFLNEDEIGWGSTEFISIRSKGEIDKTFSYFFANSKAFKDYAVANMNGSSGRQRVKAETLAQYAMPLPPSELIKQFTNVSSKNMKMMTSLKNEIISLQQLRDILLPKLLSGKIEI